MRSTISRVEFGMLQRDKDTIGIASGDHEQWWRRRGDGWSQAVSVEALPSFCLRHWAVHEFKVGAIHSLLGMVPWDSTAAMR
jgi:hypothetical protein